MRPGVRRIAVWYWEVDRLPEEWRPEIAWASEVWAPTTFLAETYRKYVNVPVVPMLPGLALPEFARLPRRFFDLPEKKHLVLFSFDMGSVMERKNPLGLIEAFRRAFRSDDRAHLCIKVSRGEFHPEDLAKLQRACRAIGATLLDRVLIREEALALMACTDCYASLHRAEGFGLGMAESMLLGTPTIGTAYSGNLDFMNRENSFLVNATPTPIKNVPPYPVGSLWAEPDLDHAATLLRQIYDDRDHAREIAQQAQREVARLLSVDAAGQRMVNRLTEIGA
jgi:glycosyltransferase involved in cell wall biosynthesis